MHFFQKDFLIAIEDVLLAHRDRMIIWAAAAMASGIGLFFHLTADPPLYWAFAPLPLGLIAWRARPYLARILLLGLFWISIGFAAALIRTQRCATPLLNQPREGIAILGTIERLELHPTGLRITATCENLPDIQSVRFVATQRHLPPEGLRVGDPLRTVMNLFPPATAAHPGGYNFRRAAFFEGVSAVGYATRPVRHLHRTADSQKHITQIQHKVRAHLTQQFPSAHASVALALTLGEKRAIPTDLRQAYATAGLAHLLAISGLHLATIAGFVLLITRRSLCMIPRLSLQYDIKKIAAIFALGCASFYLVLCWGSVSALRAYTMMAITYFALFVDRRALSLRNLALTAIGILVWWPEALLGPSFQLSFSAVLGLIAGFAIPLPFNPTTPAKRAAGAVLRIVVTTLNTTLATMPFALYHFQQFSLYGLWANILAIPLTTFVLMPALFFYILFLPLGNSALLAGCVYYAIDALNQLALWVGKMSFAALKTPPLPTEVMVLFTFSLLWIAMWHHRMRYLGLLGLTAGVALWCTAPTPVGIIDFEGNAFALRSGKKLEVSHKRNGFLISQWQSYTQAQDFMLKARCPGTCHQQLAGHEITWNRKGLLSLVHHGKDLQHQHPRWIVMQDGTDMMLIPFPDSGGRLWDPPTLLP